MVQILVFFFGTLLYMECIYHIGCFGFSIINPLIALPLWIVVAALGTLLTGFLRKKVNKVIFFVLLAVAYLLFASQLVYLNIFKQPLLLAAVTNAGAAAVTNYWREMLRAIFSDLLYLLLLAVPFVAGGLLIKFEKIPLKSHGKGERVKNAGVLGVGILLYILVLLVGKFAKTDYYENYSIFYDPKGVIERYGVIPSIVRDTVGNLFFSGEEDLDRWEDFEDIYDGTDGEGTDTVSGGDASVSGGDASELNSTTVDRSPNVLPIDFDKLIAEADSEKVIDVAEYMRSMSPTKKNEHTGMFEGYNLIFLTAEGFCTYAIDEELTPTLYKLANSGFVFENYYVPLWQTSTSDGEYANFTGLIPDQQFSLKRSAGNEMPFALPTYFAREGVKSYAYHNNSLSYYARNLTHPNLGYNFKACKLGDLNEKEWGGQVFEMEKANQWPASDYNMMVATIPEYINEDRFHVYYMTVSGHMNYNFKGNSMSYKHMDEVAELPYSEEGRAYIACNMELDKALEYLLAQLEAAGKLENTVICLSADHYPYDMDVANLEELAGKPLANSLEIYRNTLILWNSEMETEIVEKPSYSLDVLPTLLNLFGFEYDSRLYVGRDIFSDSAPLLIFSDRSFITNRLSYYKKDGTFTWNEGYTQNEDYEAAMKKQVRGLYNYAAGILNNDFYRYVMDVLPEEYQSRIDPEWTAPHDKVEKAEIPETTPETIVETAPESIIAE